VGNKQVVIMCVATLALTGLVMVYSNTAVSDGVDPAGNPSVVRQAAWLVLSAAAIALFACVDYHVLGRHSRVIMALTVVALVALLALARPVNGARRWFHLGPMNLQISEFAKIAVILYIAGFVSRKRAVLGEFRSGFVPVVLIIGLTFGLIVLQPDFGTSVLIGSVAMTMLLVSGARWRHAGPLFAVASLGLFLLVRMKPYRWERVIAFINPWADPQGVGYHSVQSLIALGCGGLTGVGPGRGLQQLWFLPEAKTDFIFAIFGQETGFLGCVLLLGVFVALFYAGMRISRSAPDSLGALIAFGVTVLIGFQMLINVAVAASAIPTKGISLPFISFGGSSLVALSVGIGILLNVARHSPNRARVQVRGAKRKGSAE